MLWQKGYLDRSTVASLRIQQKALLKFCVSRETSFDPENWSEKDPSRGQCVMIALAIQKYFGGEILRAPLDKVPGYEKMKSHYWNRLSCGAEVDLAADQFKGTARDSLEKGETRSAEELLKNPDTKRRFDIVSERFTAIIELLLEMKRWVKTYNCQSAEAA